MEEHILTKDEIREKYRKGNDLNKINTIPAMNASPDGRSEEEQKVAVYCRVSTDGIMQVTSFELQKKYYIKYVKNHPNWKLVGLYSDEGISATTVKNRIGLQMMLQDAVAGKIDLIVIKSISRFCRNLGDSLRIIKELKNLPRPVGIFFETENMSTLDPTMDLIIKVLSMVAEEESKKKSEAITAACRQKYSEGFFNVPPSLGYRRSGVNTIEIDPEEAETVKIIYEMYLAGFEPTEIAKTLTGMKRKKHTHRYVDGHVREGDSTWTAENVLNIFENEKKCGDVLAQKTFTYDCIEHIVRKNERMVPMYYAKDQHPAIISREEFYLALRLKHANKGRWNNGRQVLQTYMEGTLKGFVLTIPRWFGFKAADYAAASLLAYGVSLPTDSIYPDYVNCEKQENNNQDSSVQHKYVFSEEDLSTTTELTAEELKILNENEKSYSESLDRIKQEMKRKDNAENQTEKDANRFTVSGRLFNTGNKPFLVADCNGVFFNKACREYFKCGAQDIIILYDAVKGRILIKPASEDEPSAVRLRWCKKNDSGFQMARCTAQALMHSIFSLMDWNTGFKYKVYGEKTHLSDEKGLMFSLADPIVRVSLRQEEKTKDFDSNEKSVLASIIDEAVCTSAFTVMLGTGMRVGEVVGLRWQDIDLEEKIIDVNHSLVYYAEEGAETTKSVMQASLPKTEAGVRKIPMLPQVYEAFLVEKSAQKKTGNCISEIDGLKDFIFANRFRQVHNPQTINRTIKRVVGDHNADELVKAKREGRKPVILPYFSCHIFRHTFCTRLCEQTDDLKSIQSIMGHADFETTMDIYAEVTDMKKHEELRIM